MMEGMSDHGLIVDVGMHRGEDTEYYLRKGFRVLAIEANPELVQAARQRFAPEISTGRLTLAHVAVADHVGEIDLFVGEETLWASTRPDMADRGLGDGRVHRVRVPCAPLSEVLRGHPTPHYVKIDVEGRDGDCIRSLHHLPEVPQYVSFEADLVDQRETLTLLDTLVSYGYRWFKLVNQATHPSEFGKHSSGPFGGETPGRWMSSAEITDRYREVMRQQATRIGYSATGRLWGVPVGRLHRPLERAYNAAPVKAARGWYTQLRGVEPGGWFDLHAAL